MKARTTEEITVSMKGWTPAQMAAVKFAKRIGSGEVVQVLHRKGVIVYGDEARKLYEAGKAIAIIDNPPPAPEPTE